MAHNYIASTYDRGSVMDYPAPRVAVDRNGRIDLSDVYAVGPGAFDVLGSAGATASSRRSTSATRSTRSSARDWPRGFCS
ncbi:MAG: hypothetical protein ACREOC_02905 [Gemmatimonadales bacterium]